MTYSRLCFCATVLFLGVLNSPTSLPADEASARHPPLRIAKSGELGRLLNTIAGQHEASEMYIASVSIAESIAPWVLITIGANRDQISYVPLIAAINCKTRQTKVVTTSPSPLSIASVMPLGQGRCLLIVEAEGNAEQRWSSSTSWKWTIADDSISELPRTPSHDPSGIAISSLCVGLSQQGFDLDRWETDEQGATIVTCESRDKSKSSIAIPIHNDAIEFAWSQNACLTELHRIYDGQGAIALRGINWKDSGVRQWPFYGKN